MPGQRERVASLLFAQGMGTSAWPISLGRRELSPVSSGGPRSCMGTTQLRAEVHIAQGTVHVPRATLEPHPVCPVLSLDLGRGRRDAWPKGGFMTKGEKAHPIRRLGGPRMD